MSLAPIPSAREGSPAATIALLLAAAASILGATTVQAQSVEITPYVGVRFGGNFVNEDFFDVFVDLEVDDGTSYGVVVDIPLNRNWNLELIYSHQESELIGDEGFFGDEFLISDIDVDYYHVGVQYVWQLGQVKPFLGGSVGATNFAPKDIDADDETRPSLSVNGGVKVMFNDNLGVRLEARAIPTLVDDNDNDVFCTRRHGRRDCYGYDDEYFFQGEALAGLIIAF